MMKFFASLTWLITALASVFIGLLGLGFDGASLLPVSPTGIKVMEIIVGASGLFSLIMYIIKFMGFSCPVCGKSPCECK